METIKGILSFGILIGLFYFLPKYLETSNFKKKIAEDDAINYEGTKIACDNPFEKNGRQYFEIVCERYQLNKIDYIENRLCKTGNDIVYGGVRYFVLGCFRQENDRDKVILHIMVEPDIKATRKSNIQYTLNNNVNGVMNGDFVVSINEKESVELLVEEIRKFYEKVSESTLKKDLELFEYKLRLGEVEKDEANKFLVLLEKYKNVPAYVSSIAGVTNALLNFINFFNGSN